MAGEGGSGGGVFLLFKMERPFVSFVFILGLCRCRIMVGNLRALSFLLPPTLVLCLRTQPKRFEREKRKEKKASFQALHFTFTLCFRFWLFTGVFFLLLLSFSLSIQVFSTFAFTFIPILSLFPSSLSLPWSFFFSVKILERWFVSVVFDTHGGAGRSGYGMV